MKVLHVAGIELLPNSGMGRISYEWKLAFERAGHQLIHVGPKELGVHPHPLLFGKKVREYVLRNNLQPDLILSHEPASGFLYFKGIPLVVFSHGIEERCWGIQRRYGFFKPSFKSRCMPAWIRFFSNSKGFRKCALALLSNSEDVAFLQQKNIPLSRMQLFHNGYYSFPQYEQTVSPNFTFLYNASWISRKGTRVMYSAFNHILQQYPHARLLLVGTGIPDQEVMAGFSPPLHPQIKIVRSFTSVEEAGFYREANAFVMPSFFEGQSVALTQAMAMGLCPIVSNNCGQKDFVRHRENGLLFETGNAASMQENIEWLLNHTAECKQMGVRAQQTVAYLNWQHAAGEVVKACERAYAAQSNPR